MRPFRPISSRVELLLESDIDTDQIYPARFLSAPRQQCGRHLFADRRTPDAPDGKAQILLTGENFGCGSSREQAVWALTQRGYRAVIGRSFADGFRANAVRNGLLLIALPAADHAACVRMADHSQVTITIDLQAQRLTDGEQSLAFSIEPFARRCLLEGLDELDYLLGFAEQIEAFEKKRQ